MITSREELILCINSYETSTIDEFLKDSRNHQNFIRWFAEGYLKTKSIKHNLFGVPSNYYKDWIDILKKLTNIPADLSPLLAEMLLNTNEPSDIDKQLYFIESIPLKLNPQEIEKQMVVKDKNKELITKIIDEIERNQIVKLFDKNLIHELIQYKERIGIEKFSKLFQRTIDSNNLELPRQENDQQRLAKLRMINIVNKYTSDEYNKLSKLIDCLTHEEKFFHLTQQEVADLQIEFDNLNEEQKNEVIEYVNIFYLGNHWLGALTYYSALLSCAQIAASKSYIFNPTIIKFDEIEDYLSAFKNMTTDSRERMIVSGFHWLALDVEIRNGKVNILVLDSLDKDQLTTATTAVMEAITNILPQASIYFANEARLKGSKGCSVFSMDDVTHLYTAEKYLKEHNLFDYFISQNQPLTTKRSYDTSAIKFTLVNLPLSLMRSSQQDLDKIVKVREDESHMPVNKRGETFSENLERTQPIKMFEHYGVSSNHNMRLEKKLNRLNQKDIKYFLTTPFEEIWRQMHQFTLESFLKRYGVEEVKNLPTGPTI